MRPRRSLSERSCQAVSHSDSGAWVRTQRLRLWWESSWNPSICQQVAKPGEVHVRGEIAGAQFVPPGAIDRVGLVAPEIRALGQQPGADVAIVHGQEEPCIQDPGEFPHQGRHGLAPDGSIPGVQPAFGLGQEPGPGLSWLPRLPLGSLRRQHLAQPLRAVPAPGLGRQGVEEFVGDHRPLEGRQGLPFRDEAGPALPGRAPGPSPRPPGQQDCRPGARRPGPWRRRPKSAASRSRPSQPRPAPGSRTVNVSGRPRRSQACSSRTASVSPRSGPMSRAV